MVAVTVPVAAILVTLAIMFAQYPLERTYSEILNDGQPTVPSADIGTRQDTPPAPETELAAAAPGWRPARKLFTIESPSRTLAINSITNNPAHGDERSFFQVKRLAAANSEYSNSVFLIPGERYEGFVYFDNASTPRIFDGSPTSGVPGVPLVGARVRVALPVKVAGGRDGGPGLRNAVVHVTAQNCSPGDVWASVVLGSQAPVRIRPVVNQTRLHTGRLPHSGIQLGDALFYQPGQLIGSQGADGLVHPEAEDSGYVEFQFVAEAI
ncbi:MAG: hypothetical protein ACRDTF_10360 [Pseudonocardiaceae bacterium]